MKAHMKFVFRLDKIERIFRLLRLTWESDVPGADGHGYSLSLALKPEVFLFRTTSFGDFVTGWELVVLGIRANYKRSKGGRFV